MIDEETWIVYGIRFEREKPKSSERGHPITPVCTTNKTWIALGSNPNWICSSYEEIENKYNFVAGRYKGEKKFRTFIHRCSVEKQH
jgi:hypothetical protein